MGAEKKGPHLIDSGNSISHSGQYSDIDATAAGAAAGASVAASAAAAVLLPPAC